MKQIFILLMLIVATTAVAQSDSLNVYRTRLDSLEAKMNRSNTETNKRVEFTGYLLSAAAAILAFDYYNSALDIDDIQYVNQDAKTQMVSTLKFKAGIFGLISIGALFVSAKNNK